MMRLFRHVHLGKKAATNRKHQTESHPRRWPCRRHKETARIVGPTLPKCKRESCHDNRTKRKARAMVRLRLAADLHCVFPGKFPLREAGEAKLSSLHRPRLRAFV